MGVVILISLTVGFAVGYCLCALFAAGKNPQFIARRTEREIGWCEYIQKIKEAEAEETKEC